MPPRRLKHMNQNDELLKLAKKGDRDARKQLIEDNVGLVWSIVRRFLDRGYEKDDLFQIGCIGLINAVDRFDMSYNVRFSTYAIPVIQGEIKSFLRDDGMIKVSRIVKANAIKIRKFVVEFENTHMRQPTVEEISDATGLEINDILLSLEADISVESIYRSIDGEKDGHIMLMDTIKGRDNAIDDAIDSIAIEKIMSQLNDEERKLIHMRYYENMTQTQVAGLLCVGQVKISRMESKIIKKMKSIAQNE